MGKVSNIFHYKKQEFPFENDTEKHVVKSQISVIKWVKILRWDRKEKYEI